MSSRKNGQFHASRPDAGEKIPAERAGLGERLTGSRRQRTLKERICLAVSDRQVRTSQCLENRTDTDLLFRKQVIKTGLWVYPGDTAGKAMSATGGTVMFRWQWRRITAA